DRHPPRHRRRPVVVAVGRRRHPPALRPPGGGRRRPPLDPRRPGPGQPDGRPPRPPGRPPAPGRRPARRMTPTTRRRTANVLVIGTGGAGLRAAIAAHEAGAEVVVIGKRARLDAHTVLASGGINAALATVDPEDSWQQHFADTLDEGYLLGDPRVVELLVREAPAAGEELAAW